MKTRQQGNPRALNPSLPREELQLYVGGSHYALHHVIMALVIL